MKWAIRRHIRRVWGRQIHVGSSAGFAWPKSVISHQLDIRESNRRVFLVHRDVGHL